ncbi:MAG: hypothetical protein NC345_13360 [Lachnospira sp.]|nr:hypothetical protein [Lachnospira sp.]
MRKKCVVLMLCGTLLLSGCGATNDDSESKTIPMPSKETNVESESVQESSASESGESEDNSWGYVSSVYPLVSYDDVKAGKYNNQYVILSVILESTDYSDVTKWLKCDAWFSSKDSYVCDDITFKCEELQGYSPTELKPGDSVDVCFFINADSSFGFTIKAYNLNGKQITLEDVYSSFSENSDLWNIDFEYCGIVKNDTTGNWRLSKVYTDFDAVDYALYYYNRYFQADNEIHAIINYSNDTTIRIKNTLGMLDVTVLSHIDGEENDAKALFGGNVIQDYMIDIESGELVNIEE